MLTSLYKAYITNVIGVPNLQYGTYVLGFFLALSSGGEKEAFGFVSGNLFGVSLRRIKTIATKRRLDPFIRLYPDEIIFLLLARTSRILRVRKDPKSRIDFTSGIDATTLVKAY